MKIRKKIIADMNKRADVVEAKMIPPKKKEIKAIAQKKVIPKTKVTRYKRHSSY